MAKPFGNALDAANELHDEDRDPADWYAGVTNDPPRRLREHAVDPEDENYNWVECVDAEVAAGAEAHLHGWGYEGGGGGGKDDTVFVYVYAITEHTCEDC